MKLTIALASVLAGVVFGHVYLPLTYAPPVTGSQGPRTDIYGSLWTYTVNVSVGTPPQDLTLAVNPNEYGTWVPDKSMCTSYLPSCYNGGAFDSSESTTYDLEEQDGFASTYTDYTSAHGDEFLDVIDLGGQQLANFSMGIIGRSDARLPMLGIGSRVASHLAPATLEALVNAKMIATQGYSIWMDNSNGTSGGLLLGAVDKSKFVPPLKRLPSRHRETILGVDFTVDFSLFNMSESSLGPAHVIIPQNGLPIVYLNPTNEFTNLPSSLSEPVWNAAGAVYDDSSKRAFVPCSGTQNPDTTLYFGLGVFGDALFEVKIGDLVASREIYSTTTLPGHDGEWCLFGIQTFTASSIWDLGESAGAYSLGRNVLGSAYLTYDLLNKEVGMARVRFDAPPGVLEENIVPFESNGSRIPESEVVGQGYCQVGKKCPEKQQPAERSGLSMTYKIAIGILVPVVVISVVGLVVWLCIRRRRKPSKLDQAIVSRTLVVNEKTGMLAPGGMKSPGIPSHAWPPHGLQGMPLEPATPQGTPPPGVVSSGASGHSYSAVPPLPPRPLA